MNLKGKGAVGMAISYYAIRGNVSIPMEAHNYNLIFDDGELHRIKVISCSYKNKSGIYTASIKTSGGNQPNFSIKKFDPKSCDKVFVVTDDLSFFEIPSQDINSANAISMNAYADYQVFIPE